MSDGARICSPSLWAVPDCQTFTECSTRARAIHRHQCQTVNLEHNEKKRGPTNANNKNTSIQLELDSTSNTCNPIACLWCFEFRPHKPQGVFVQLFVCAVVVLCCSVSLFVPPDLASPNATIVSCLFGTIKLLDVWQTSSLRALRRESFLQVWTRQVLGYLTHFANPSLGLRSSY